METIGIIAAMAEECAALLRCAVGVERARFGALPGYRFVLGQRHCLLVRCGIGSKRAIEAVRVLHALEKPQWLVSFGVAGSVSVDLQIGDVVAVEAACWLKEGLPGPPQRLAAFSAVAQEAAAQALLGRGVRLVVGTAVTTAGAQTILAGPAQLNHPVLEMETAGAAQAAAQLGIALAGLRGISDNPQAPLPLDLGVVMDEAYRLRAGRLLGEILRRPRVIGQFIQMRRNTRTAADNAAVVLTAMLSQPGQSLCSASI